MEFQALKCKALENKDFKKEWDAQAPLWKIQKQLIQARIKSNLTQSTNARRKLPSPNWITFSGITLLGANFAFNGFILMNVFYSLFNSFLCLYFFDLLLKCCKYSHFL